MPCCGRALIRLPSLHQGDEVEPASHTVMRMATLSPTLRTLPTATPPSAPRVSTNCCHLVPHLRLAYPHAVSLQAYGTTMARHLTSHLGTHRHHMGTAAEGTRLLRCSLRRSAIMVAAAAAVETVGPTLRASRATWTQRWADLVSAVATLLLPLTCCPHGCRDNSNASRQT